MKELIYSAIVSYVVIDLFYQINVEIIQYTQKGHCPLLGMQKDH